MPYVAVVDIGKTNAKLAIVDADLRKEIDVLTTPNTVVNSPPYPHFDTEKLWQFLLGSLQTFATRFNVSAISITTHGASAALLDEHGQLATPILDYEFNGPDQTASDYLNIRPPFESTGSPYLPAGLNAGAQLYWQFQLDPQLHSRVRAIVMYPQYWAYRFCGVLANEPTSLGCHTDLWHPVKGRYSDLVDTLSIRDKMADVKLPSTRLASVLPAVADSTGLDINTPVYCGIHDSNASLYTHLATMELPFSVVSTGTWVVCLSPGSNQATLDETRDTLLNVSALGEPTPSSRFMGGREYDYLVNRYSATKTDELIRRVIDSKACILPAVESSSGPYPHGRYQWTVDPETLSPAERYNVISFYLAMMTDTCLSLCGATGNIIIEGPFATNRSYCAMLSAAADRPVLVSDGNATGTSVGAALLASENSAKGVADAYSEMAVPDSVRHLRTYCQTWRQLTKTHISATQSE